MLGRSSRRRRRWRHALVATLALGCKPEVRPATPVVAAPAPVTRVQELQSQRYSLEQLLDPAPCELSPEARVKIGPAGADADSALLCGVCPKLVLGSGERLECELPFETDPAPVSIPPSRMSAWSFNITFGSFTQPNTSQAVVLANVDENHPRVRYFLMDRRERRWSVLGTHTSDAVPRPPFPTTLRDANGQHVLIGVFETDAPSRLDVRALRFTSEHVEAVNLLRLGDCSEPSTAFTNGSRTRDSAVSIRAAGSKLVVNAEACSATSEPKHKRRQSVDLAFEYDGARFTASRPTRSRLKLEGASLAWQPVAWELPPASAPAPRVAYPSR
jgi:hypothetical protein